MKKRNLFITTAIAGLMVFPLSTAAMAKGEASEKAVVEAEGKAPTEARADLRHRALLFTAGRL